MFVASFISSLRNFTQCKAACTSINLFLNGENLSLLSAIQIQVLDCKMPHLWRDQNELHYFTECLTCLKCNFLRFSAYHSGQFRALPRIYASGWVTVGKCPPGLTLNLMSQCC